MIDVHCHLLPDLDDGSKSLEMSEEMAKIAVEDGIEAVIATPHSGPGEDRLNPKDILDTVQILQKRLQEKGIPLKVYPGEEVEISAELVEELQSGKILPLAGTKWVLVELPFQQLPIFAERVLFQLQTAGYHPIIAHPERNGDIEKNWEVALRMMEHGAGLQLDTMSLLGQFGSNARRTSEQLLRASSVVALGSDGHSTGHRRIVLSAARDRAAEIVGQHEADLLTGGNASAMIQGKTIYPVQYDAKRESRGLFASIKKVFHRT